jgi:hypothetical protein
VIESGFIIFRVTHNKWWIVNIQGIGWPKWNTSLVLIWTSSSTACFNSHWLPPRTPQLPLVTFESLCWNCKHVMSHFVLKVGVAERLMSQLGVVTFDVFKMLQDPLHARLKIASSCFLSPPKTQIMRSLGLVKMVFEKIFKQYHYWIIFYYVFLNFPFHIHTDSSNPEECVRIFHSTWISMPFLYLRIYRL